MKIPREVPWRLLVDIGLAIAQCVRCFASFNPLSTLWGWREGLHLLQPTFRCSGVRTDFFQTFYQNNDFSFHTQGYQIVDQQRHTKTQEPSYFHDALQTHNDHGSETSHSVIECLGY